MDIKCCYSVAPHRRRFILRDAWRGSSNAGNLLPFIFLKLSTSLSKWKWKLEGSQSVTSHIQSNKENEGIQGAPQPNKHSKISTFLVHCVSRTPTTSQLNAQEGRWTWLLTVLWHFTSQSPKEANSTLGLQVGAGCNYDQGNTGLLSVNLFFP